MAVSDHGTGHCGQVRQRQASQTVAGGRGHRAPVSRPEAWTYGRGRCAGRGARGGCERGLHLRVECQVWFRLLPVPDPPCSATFHSRRSMRGAVHAVIANGHGCRDGEDHVK